MSVRLGEPAAVTVTLSMPGLADHPFVGSGCCVLPAPQVVAEEIQTWPGVETVTVDESGTASIILGSEDVDLTPILDSLAALGYPAEVQIHPVQERR